MTRRPVITGRTQPDVNTVTPEKLAMIVELLPTVLSLRDLAAMLDLTLDAVRREAAPFLALMKVNGTHPKCGCGRDRFHPYGCVDSYAKAIHQNAVPGHRRMDHARVLERRAKVVEMLVDGERFIDIDKAVGFKNKTARGYLRFLTPEQRARREAIIPPRKISQSNRGACQ